MLAIKQKIECRELICKRSQENELITILLETKLAKPILIASIYVPLRAGLNINLFHELYVTKIGCIIVGDLKAALLQIGYRRTNAKGKQLPEIINETY